MLSQKHLNFIVKHRARLHTKLLYGESTSAEIKKFNDLTREIRQSPHWPSIQDQDEKRRLSISGKARKC